MNVALSDTVCKNGSHNTGNVQAERASHGLNSECGSSLHVCECVNDVCVCVCVYGVWSHAMYVELPQLLTTPTTGSTKSVNAACSIS